MLKINKKRIIKLSLSAIALVLVIAMFLALSRCSTEMKQLPVFKQLSSYPELEDETLAENDDLAILWDDNDKVVYLLDKKTGTKWGPRSIESDTGNGVTVSKKIPKIFSSIYISYYDKDSCTVINDVLAQSASVEMETVAAKTVKNGVLVRYDFPEEKISVTVSYTLKKNSMVVTVDKSKITEGSRKLVTSVSVAPFMCSVFKDDKDAYLFVPSGSGALIYPETVVDKTISTEEKVFGDDAAINKDFEFFTGEAVRLPVYGTKVGNSGLCAIITSDEEKSEIDTVSQDKNTGMSAVYAKTYIRGYDIIDMPEGFGSGGTTKLVSDPIADSVFAIEFYPFGGENCSYVDMAEIYRNYLYSANKKETEKTDAETAFNLNILGGAEVTKHFLGVPYTGLLALTDLKDADKIITETEQTIGNNYIVTLQGFTESGVDIGKPAGNGKISAKLGGTSELKKLLGYADKIGIKAFVNFDTVRYNSAGFGCSRYDAAQRVDKKRVTLTYKSKVSGMPATNAKSYRLVGRSELDAVNNKLIAKAKKYGINTVSLDSLTSMCYSDYFDEDYYICGGVSRQTRSILKKYSKEKISILGSSANAYAAIYCSHITNAPLSSTDSDSFTYGVPFYEMVFKGYIPMSSKPVNTFYNLNNGILKAVEAGIGITYEVVGKYDEDLKYSVQNLSYVMTADEIKERLNDADTKKFADYFNKIKGASIKSHKIMSEYVREVTFDNGVTVYVNYGCEPTVINGTNVAAEDYAYTEGGGNNG